jgi:hypothetical protein
MPIVERIMRGFELQEHRAITDTCPFLQALVSRPSAIAVARNPVKAQTVWTPL